jgi:1-acyl-sn-glycerol-3-phosphate acyltransferase
LKPYYDVDSLENRDEKLMWQLSGVVDNALRRYHKADVLGMQRIPPGPALYVGNHSAGLLSPDSFILGSALLNRRPMSDLPYSLAHEVAIGAPGLNHILAPLGAVRACHENAARIFERGCKVLVYPGGDEDSLRPYRMRHQIRFGGRQGYIRLALRHGVPIIPVVCAGAHETFIVIDDLPWLAKALRLDKFLRVKVWPLTLSIPWGLTIGVAPPHFPLPSRILLEVLEPIQFDRTGNEAAQDPEYVTQCAAFVESRMQDGLDRLEQKRKEPLERS